MLLRWPPPARGEGTSPPVPAGHWPEQAQGSLNQSLEFCTRPRGRGGWERPTWLPEGPGRVGRCVSLPVPWEVGSCEATFRTGCTERPAPPSSWARSDLPGRWGGLSQACPPPSPAHTLSVFLLWLWGHWSDTVTHLFPCQGHTRVPARQGQGSGGFPAAPEAAPPAGRAALRACPAVPRR